MDQPYLGQTTQPDGAELAAKLVSLFSFSLLSTLFGIKTYNVHFRYLSYSRWLVLALYVFSWAFTTISMVLVTTNNRNYVSCFLSIMVCDIFYSGTKLAIYAWLIEKIYVVSSIRTTRWKSKTYRFHICLMLPYIAIFTLMLVFHVSEVQDSGICIIGLQSVASLPLLIYDFLINLYMTVFFIKPLIQLGHKKKNIDWKASRLNEVALRTLVASVVCLVASFANVFALVMFNGRERGLVCLTCCTVDVTINVITVHWVTTHTPGKRVKDQQSNNAYSSNNPRESNSNIKPAADNASDIIDNLHGFTKREEIKPAPPYTTTNVTIVEKNDDLESTDSSNFFGTSSIHSSRKSLTKK